MLTLQLFILLFFLYCRYKVFSKRIMRDAEGSVLQAWGGGGGVANRSGPDTGGLHTVTPRPLQ